MNYYCAKPTQQTRSRNTLCFFTSVVCLLVLTFQASLASPGVPADFNGDSFEDLAVGIPGEDIDGITGAGAVQVFYGGADGMFSGNQLRPLRGQSQ